MGATYTRQSSSAIVDGGIIEAADINAEFNQILAAFAVTSGHTHDGTTAEGGPITKLLGTAITIGDATAGTDIAVTFDGETADGVLTWMEDEDYFKFSDDILMNSTERLNFGDTGTYIFQSTDGQLDIVADTEVQIAATTIDINGAVDISGALTLAGTTLAETISDTVGAMVSSNTETGITVSYEDGDNTLDFALGAAQTTITSLFATDIKIGEDNETKIDFETANEIHLYAANAEQVYVADGIFGPQTDSDVDLGTTGVRWKDAFIDTITTTGNVTVGGDLTVSGDDIIMGTNTAGNLLIADGTNFNSVAATSLSEISTIANDDVFLAVDTSGGGLKKVARSTVVSGLATSAAISNVSEDSTPQLGGDLDVNGNGLTSTSNGNIALTPNGTGVVRIDGSSGIDMQSGSISIKNSGAQSYIDFYCESSNAHYARLQAPAHSAFSGNATITLPSDTTILASTNLAETLSNKTLSTPIIAEIDSGGGSSITLDAATDIILDAGGADVILKDDGTTFGSLTNSSGELVIKSGSTPTTAMTFSGANVTFAGTVTIGSAGISEAELEILDGATATTAELNLLDGDTSVGSSITLADADGIVTNDGGTMKTIPASDIKTFVGAGAGAFSIANLDIDGGTDISADLTTSDLIVVDDGAGGTNRKAALSRIVTLMSAQGFVTDDPTALAIALG